MIQELELVVLLHDVDEFNLQRGDVGTVVHAYTNGPAYEVEFVTADGYTAALLMLTSADIRALDGPEILHARPITTSAEAGSP